MKNILIPVDGSEYSDRAIKKGQEIIKMTDCHIVLLNVINNTLPYFTVESTDYGKKIFNQQFSYADKIKREAVTYLEKGKQSFAEDENKIEIILTEGDPSDKILEYLNENEIDLVIIGAKGLGSRLQSLLVGGVTMKILHYAKQPVLVIK